MNYSLFKDNQELDAYLKKVEVVVTAVDDNKFLITMVCPKRQGWFTKLMETIAEIGLEVMNINVASLKGIVSTTIFAHRVVLVDLTVVVDKARDRSLRAEEICSLDRFPYCSKMIFTFTVPIYLQLD
ncbi:hypothetical protein ACLOJK_039666 [Asimina triloba]